MAKVLLLPGFGGIYVTTVPGGGTAVDEIDCSKAASLIFQTTIHVDDATTITVEETFDGVNWATLTTFSATLGTIKKLTYTSGPFGRIRFKANGTTGSCTITTIGMPFTDAD